MVKKRHFPRKEDNGHFNKITSSNIVLYIKNVSINYRLQAVGLIIHFNFQCNETTVCSYKHCVFDNFIELNNTTKLQTLTQSYVK